MDRQLSAWLYCRIDAPEDVYGVLKKQKKELYDYADLHRQYGSCMNTADRSSVRRIWRFIKAVTHLAAKLSAENAAAPLSVRSFTSGSLTKRFNGAAVSILRIFQNVVRNLSGRTASNKPLSPCGTGLWVIMKKSCFPCWKF